MAIHDTFSISIHVLGRILSEDEKFGSISKDHQRAKKKICLAKKENCSLHAFSLLLKTNIIIK